MNAYTGTILYVSHDRYFINKTATRILEISDHGLTSYPGNYQDYIAQKEKEKASLTSSTASSVSVDTESKLDWKQQKEEQAKQRKKENRLKTGGFYEINILCCTLLQLSGIYETLH